MPENLSDFPSLDEAASKRLADVAEMLLYESDRGCAIFGAAILEDDLEALLRAFCRNDEATVRQVVDPLFQSYAPFATFSAKIQLTFVLRLITRDLKQKLDVVRRLRNDFAHELGPLTFQAPECQDRLRLLIPDDKPSAPLANEEDRMPNMGLTTKRQFVDRLAFMLWVAKTSGMIRWVTEQVVAGRDPRLIVERLDARDPSST